MKSLGQKVCITVVAGCTAYTVYGLVRGELWKHEERKREKKLRQEKEAAIDLRLRTVLDKLFEQHRETLKGIQHRATQPVFDAQFKDIIEANDL